MDHSLRADHGLLSRWLLVAGLALFTAWMGWAFSVRVTRYEVSDSARLEVAGAAVPVQANQGGQVLSTHFSLGQEVEGGTVLIELDDHDQRLALQQEQRRRAELEPELAALRMQLQAEDAGRVDEARVLVYSTSGAQAQWREAQSEANLAMREAQRAARMRTEGLISEADAQKARAFSDSKRAAVESLEQAALRLAPELQVRNSERVVKQRGIQTEMSKLQADMASSDASMGRLRYEIEKRKMRAPAAGRVTECAVLHRGAYVHEGQQLGVILPAGKVQVIADFNPASALGKLHPGQRASVRLNGFPWAQFGILEATVSRVAGEIREGKVRVELDLRRDAQVRIPLQHGLPGSVEVEVERVTPAAMLMRSAGQALGAH